MSEAVMVYIWSPGTARGINTNSVSKTKASKPEPYGGSHYNHGAQQVDEDHEFKASLGSYSEFLSSLCYRILVKKKKKRTDTGLGDVCL